MMFGYRDSFEYMECSRCGCLGLVNAPADMTKYYASTYYSFSPVDPKPLDVLKSAVKRRRSAYTLGDGGLLSRALFSLFPHHELRTLIRAGLSRTSRILDVGCGSGKLLQELQNAGFEQLLGVDPMLSRDIQYPNGLQIRKSSIYGVTGEWDLVMFHHSFEHLADPLETLRYCARLLAENGRCVIRTPTVSSYAWKEYRENWVQLDAPRHYFLYSVRGLDLLASRTGLSVENVVYDSSDFQFWGSEQYRRDIPLTDARSYAKNPAKSIFSRKEIRSFQKRAAALNARKEGDQAVFYLTKVNPYGRELP